MNKIALIAVMVLAAAPLRAQIGTQKHTPPQNVPPVNQNAGPDQKSSSRLDRIGTMLQPEARIKCERVVKLISARAATGAGEADLVSAAQKELRGSFTRLTDTQCDLLTCYVLSKAGRTISPRDTTHAAPRKKTDLDERTAGNLQMQMDRKSKFNSTISNMLKKISDTQDALVGNIK